MGRMGRDRTDGTYMTNGTYEERRGRGEERGQLGAEGGGELAG